ncbi:MAG TPA: restriction endonuclease [Chitinophagales bacterium]|jgi:restriction system protein|nr:restriction endonuclease [Chitinophagales bacterium]HPA35623.1 restriction endonuclease [Chitinophagales bacterium]HQO88683.1 restriction endonuclease [Chitinophagales bacterium]
MEIPKFDETFVPILEILKTGKTYKTRELIEEVKTKFYSGLTEEQKKLKTKSGDLLIDNRIAWGKSYLKKGGYVFFPERGHVQITEKGKNHSSNLSLRDLEKESSLFEFYKSEKTAYTENDKIDCKISSPQDLIDEGFNRIESEVKNELLLKLKNIDPYFFEKVVLILLKKMGYGEFIETSKSGDGGIDGIINEDKLGLDKIYIQAKRFNEGKVREKDIRNFIGAMSGDTNKGVFVTTSEFDEKAVEKARSAHHKIICIDGKKLVTLMHEFNVGIQVKMTYEIKQIDEDFFDEQ